MDEIIRGESMEYGVLSLEYGVWSLEFGAWVWSMEFGSKATVVHPWQ